MMIFMLAFFGYMDYMIMYKWVTPLENPPSIINSLIAMGMWQTDPNPMFDPQIPRVLMAISMLTVPWLLIPKPTILYFRMKAQHQAEYRPTPRLEGDEKVEEEEAHHDFGEIVIHQVIETIEYVLGTVSHTASYLRLWALSLAHQQLSLVFFQKTILAGMSTDFPANCIVLYIMFAAWFGVTVGVLLGMDVLECFLHCLRLHWVEFQSKFYNVGGDGTIFTPFNHAKILASSSKE